MSIRPTEHSTKSHPEGETVRQQTSLWLAVGAVTAVALLVVNVIMTFHNTQQLNNDAKWVAHTHKVIISLKNILSLVKDAETGQRGFIITGETVYLEPYKGAIATLNQQLEDLEQLTADNPQRQARLPQVRDRIDAKLSELEETIALRQNSGFEAAQQVVLSDRGKQEMDALQNVIGAMIQHERGLLQILSRRSKQTYQIALVSGAISGLSALAALAALILLLRRHLDARDSAAAVIAEQASQLRATLASIGDGVITTDAAGRITNLNAIAELLTGWKNNEAIGKPLDVVFQIVNEDTRQPVTNPAIRALEKGVIVGLANHTLLIARDGTARPIDDSAAPIRRQVNEVVGCVLVFRDVSARRQVEKQLQESEARFRQIADAMPQMVWVTRPDGYHEYYNQRWYNYIGCTPADCLGYGWNAPLHPDDQQLAVDRWSHSLRTGEDYEIEYRFRSKNGEYRWFLGRALPVRDEAGEIVKWFGTCTDIEEAKQLEADRQKFVWLANNSADFIGMFDLAGVPFYANPAALSKVGLDSLEAACQINISALFFPEDQDRIVNEFLPSVLAQGSGTTEVRFRHLKTGAAIWMVYKVTTLTDTSGQTVGLATISQDVTEQRQLETNLRQLAADLSEADHRKDEFLATLAHELRNPLAPIRNGLQVMRLAADDGRAVEQARAMMERQLVQMVRLIDDLLDVSRISQGKINLRRDRVELASIIDQAVETSHPVIESAQQDLTVTLPPQPVYLYADQARLAQVFSNLMNNASKYSEPGERITLTAQQQGSEVVISVQDTGVGISAEMLPNIFSLFTQVDQSIERSQGGLGIGLTLVQRLVELHGGSVEASSPGLGQGSEFTVRLPTTAEPLPPQPEPLADKSSTAIARRILIVDDNRDSALSLSLLFELTGDETHTVHDGLAAVQAAATFRPDVGCLTSACRSSTAMK
ncbi:MAG: PAS domain S-box protein [Leptolyngbyaceae cyanobacterium SM1_1_3]|nr:PAS domain S-box protein [Leptolyngbyaceae cyanobacterium SM1_1_3]